MASSGGALSGSTLLHAHANVASASVEVWDFDLFAPQLRLLREDRDFRLDLCVNGRLPDARLRFTDRWASHRFEAPGKLFLLPPNETLHVRSGVGHQEVIVCRLPRERVCDWLDAEPDWNERRLEASVDIASHAISNLLLRLGQETRQPGFGRDVVIGALAVQLAVELERHFQHVAAPDASSGLPQWRLRSIDERLRENPEPPSLSELATICGLSVRQLSRSFKASRGLSIGAYVAQHRAEEAKALLRRGEPVKVVSAKMGFASPSSFGYAFRKATGQSPSEFRSRSR
jgi:AraC family transcriptional regulator